MISKTFRNGLLSLTLACAVVSEGLAQSSANIFLIRYAVIMSGKEPFLTERTCERGKFCQMTDASRKIEIELKRPIGSRELSEIKITCLDFDCSFANGKANILFSNNDNGNEFVVMDGEPGFGLEVPLVQKYHSEIGRIIVKY